MFAAAWHRYDQLFRWRVQFGLTVRKTPQLATVLLADGAVNQVPALSKLRDLARPPDEMTGGGLEILAVSGDAFAVIVGLSTSTFVLTAQG
jgi:hypothetical protein